MNVSSRFALILALSVHISATAQASGSGFFITSTGIAVTNFHVVENASAVQLIDAAGVRSDATILRVDRANDLALLQVNNPGTSFLQVASSSSIRRGQKVYALGFPRTSIQGIEPKLTDGIISSLSGMRDEPRTFQITNPIQPGNSGGPLLTDDGRVVGVVVSMLNAVRVLEVTGSLPQNVNYAIKSNYLLELVASVGTIRLPPLLPHRGNRRLVDVVAEAERALVRVLVTTVDVAAEVAPSPVPRPPERSSFPAPAPAPAPAPVTRPPNRPFGQRQTYLNANCFSERDANNEVKWVCH